MSELEVIIRQLVVWPIHQQTTSSTKGMAWILSSYTFYIILLYKDKQEVAHITFSMAVHLLTFATSQAVLLYRPRP
jgi:hypothetical protein